MISKYDLKIIHNLEEKKALLVPYHLKAPYPVQRDIFELYLLDIKCNNNLLYYNLLKTTAQ